MNNIRLLATTLCMTGAMYGSAATLEAFKPTPRLAALVDSLDDDDEPADTATKTRRNIATDFNALKYVMERRYRNYGDKFTKRWDDHLFLEFGAGFSNDINSGASSLSPITMAHVGIGKQFNRLHTARLTFGAGYGHFDGTKKNYQRVYVNADWLCSLTTFMDGYNPSRLFDMSTMFGVGYRYNSGRGHYVVRGSKEIHGGLSMRFFTGPQGYLVVEPFAGVSSSHLYNKYGFFYGANLNFVYYLHNNLSIEERMRYMRNRPEAVDSILKPASWRTPWFAELSGGVVVFKGSANNSTQPGNATTVSLGRWLSPVIGLRLSGGFSSVTWHQDKMAMGIADEERRVELGVPEQEPATLNRHNSTIELKAEALVNPFGFMKGDTWERPWGVNLVFGGGICRLLKNQEQELRCTSTFFTAGLHFYGRLTDDLQVFVEPRYANYNYNIPYSNISRFKRFSDDVFSFNIGLTAYTRGLSYRAKAPEYVAPKIPLSVGVGGGTSLTLTKNSYKGAGLNYNFNAFAEWHFNQVHSARVAFEYMQLNSMSAQRYHAADLTQETKGYNAIGLFKHSYRRGFLSLDYLLNVTNLCSGYQGRRMIEAELFAGPTIMFAIGATHSADASVKVAPDHAVQAKFGNYTAPLLGANGGVKLKLNATKNIAVTMTPQIHLLRYNPQLSGLNLTKFRGFETLDFGVQYDF